MRSLFGYVEAACERDRSMAVFLSVIGTVLGIVLLLTGLIVWPVVFHEAAAGRGNAIITANIILMAVLTALSVIMTWVDNYYSFLKTFLICYLIGMIMNIVVLMVCPIMEFSLSGVFEKLMNLIVAVFGGGMLSVLPVLIASVIGWLVRACFRLSHPGMM